MKIYNFASILLFFVFSSVSAQELAGVSVEPAEIIVGQAVQITVDFNSKGNSVSCGLLINFGDGSSQNVRIEANKLPLKLAHTYDRVGNFPLSAEGLTQIRGFKTAFACSGASRSAAVNVRAEDFAAKEAIELAAKEAAFQKAATERQAAERAAEKATAERITAERTSKLATAERSAAERTARAAAAERSAAERAAQKATADRYAAEKAAASGAAARATAEKEAARNSAAQRTAEKATADRLAAEKAASVKDESSRSLPAEAESPKRPAPVKARSAMDL